MNYSYSLWIYYILNKYIYKNNQQNEINCNICKQFIFGKNKYCFRCLNQN